MKNISLLIFLFTLIGCQDHSVDPNMPNEKKWEEIPLFKKADVRYMKVHDGTLYVSAVLHNFSKDSSVIFKTKDGEQWDTLKTFEYDIGPFAFHLDTLSIVETGRIWDYHPSIGWKLRFKVRLGAWLTRDIIYLNDELSVFEGRYHVYGKNTVREILSGGIISRFVKLRRHGKEVAYTMPYYIYLGVPWEFDGYNMVSLGNGISTDENKQPNYPALGVLDDTLYSGFSTPTRIKRLVDDVWENFTDTIPNPTYNILTVPLSNTAASILFYNKRMFVGTERSGILEWTEYGWVSHSNGLPKLFPDYPSIEIYTSVIFLEQLNGVLFVGYGEPAFGPLYRGRGMYKYKIE